MPLISFGTGPAVENETRWEIKEAIQAGHRCDVNIWPDFDAAFAFSNARVTCGGPHCCHLTYNHVCCLCVGEFSTLRDVSCCPLHNMPVISILYKVKFTTASTSKQGAWAVRGHCCSWLCRHFDVSTTGQLGEVQEGLGLAFLEKMLSRDELWITATVSAQPLRSICKNKEACSSAGARANLIEVTEPVLYWPCVIPVVTCTPCFLAFAWHYCSDPAIPSVLKLLLSRTICFNSD